MMRRDWDERARSNAFHYIASWRKDWNLKSFVDSGDEDYERLVRPILETLQFDPRGKSMIELGCGAGRMTRSFAQRFAQVTAVDIFFFQAEDGIRYYKVTGVQTCALPI